MISIFLEIQGSFLTVFALAVVYRRCLSWHGSSMCCSIALSNHTVLLWLSGYTTVCLGYFWDVSHEWGFLFLLSLIDTYCTHTWLCLGHLQQLRNADWFSLLWEIRKRDILRKIQTFALLCKNLCRYCQMQLCRPVKVRKLWRFSSAPRGFPLQSQKTSIILGCMFE